MDNVRWNYSSLNEYLRQFPQSHDTNSIQYGVCDLFWYSKPREIFRRSDVFDKATLDEVTFRRSDYSAKTFDEVS